MGKEIQRREETDDDRKGTEKDSACKTVLKRSLVTERHLFPSLPALSCTTITPCDKGESGMFHLLFSLWVITM